MNKQKIVIVVPTYNEKKNIKDLIDRIFRTVPKIYVVVVDDSPNKETIDEVKKLSKKYPRLKSIYRGSKLGRGSAVIEGFSYAKRTINPDIYIEIDADLSHDPKELNKIISQSKENTVVVGSRYVKGSKIVNWPLERRIASKFSNLLVRTILGIPMHDNTNGYRCYSRKAIGQVIKLKFISGGYIVLSEMAFNLKKRGFSFVEVPIVFRNRRKGESSASIREFLNAFFNMWKIRFHKYS